MARYVEMRFGWHGLVKRGIRGKAGQANYFAVSCGLAGEARQVLFGCIEADFYHRILLLGDGWRA